MSFVYNLRKDRWPKNAIHHLILYVRIIKLQYLQRKTKIIAFKAKWPVCSKTLVNGQYVEQMSHIIWLLSQAVMSVTKLRMMSLLNLKVSIYVLQNALHYKTTRQTIQNHGKMMWFLTPVLFFGCDTWIFGNKPLSLYNQLIWSSWDGWKVAPSAIKFDIKTIQDKLGIYSMIDTCHLNGNSI